MGIMDRILGYRTEQHPCAWIEPWTTVVHDWTKPVESDWTGDGLRHRRRLRRRRLGRAAEARKWWRSSGCARRNAAGSALSVNQLHRGMSRSSGSDSERDTLATSLETWVIRTSVGLLGIVGVFKWAYVGSQFVQSKQLLLVRKSQQINIQKVFSKVLF